MTIVFVIDNFCSQTNGTTITAKRFADGLRKRGHTVRIISNGVSGADMFDVPTRNIPIVSKVSLKNETTFAAYDEQVFLRAYENADLIHFFVPWQLSIKGRNLAEKLNIPYTAAFHCQPENVTYNLGLKWFRPLNTMLYARFKRRFYKKCLNIHCPSEFIADQLKKNRYYSRLHIISNGVADCFKPQENVEKPTTPLRQKDKINILMIGRLAPEKRQDLLINAVNNSKYRDKIQLFFAGNGPSKKKYQKLAKKLPNYPVFGFYNQQQLLDLIYSTDLYVHASDVEIEAIACIEAFSCGKVPVISNSKKSATKQFALSKNNLFKCGNYKDLAQKIDFWIENDRQRQEFEQKYAEYGKFFNLDYSILKAEEMFAQAIKDHRSQNLLKEQSVKSIVKRTKNGLTFRNFFSQFVYLFVASPVLTVINRFGFGLKIKNKKALRKVKNSGAVTICNHMHNLDATMCCVAFYPRKPRFPTLPENLKIPVAGQLLDILGGIPTPQSPTQNKVFFYQLSKNVLRRKLVHFYPEGHLIPYSEKLRDFKRGAFHLAASTNVPIVPMRIVCRQPKGIAKRWKKGKPFLTLVIGEPIFPDHKLLKKDAELLLKAQCEQAMEKLQA